MMKKSAPTSHRDLLDKLNERLSISEKIAFLHRVARRECAFVHRIGVAVYDSRHDLLQTFAHSSDGDSPLAHYQCKLCEAPSLYRIAMSGRPRIIHDLQASKEGQRTHTRKIRAAAYRSSYTIPIYHQQQLAGFIFFNSRLPAVFQPTTLPHLDMIARLISLLVTLELGQITTLQGALRTAACLSGHKDPETGAHLERMARFSRLIANALADRHQLEDEFVEAVFWFAPMHDVGKIAIPDAILRKPGPLSADEFAVMKTHPVKGREMIDTLLGNFGLDDFRLASMVRHIVEYHHENMDGSGYPRGLRGNEIPLESRIVAVADVFDALTSARPYKKAWPNAQAFATLREMAQWKLDPECVECLIAQEAAIEDIQATFRDPHAEEAAASHPHEDDLHPGLFMGLHLPGKCLQLSEVF